MLRLFFIIPIVFIFLYASSKNITFGSNELVLNGKMPKGYELHIEGIYISSDDRCKESDWNTGGKKYGITFAKGSIKYKDGNYKAKLYKQIKKNFCNWHIIIAQALISYPKKDLNATHQVDNPLYMVRVAQADKYQQKSALKVQNGILKEDFTCIREDRIKTYDYSKKKYIKTYLNCVSKHMNNELNIDGNFTKLKRVVLNFNVKKDIYCFVSRRSCPAYTKIMYGKMDETLNKLAVEAGYKKPKPIVVHKYKIDKSSQKLFNSMYIDDGDYNISAAKNIIKSNNNYITKPGYAIFQYALAGSFAGNEIDFSTIKFLAKHGYNIAKYQQEYYVDKNITSIIKKFDIEEEPWCQGYDYATLPEAIKQKLKDKGITLKNYYSKRERKHRDRLLYNIGGYYNDESPKIIKWMLSQGYRPKKGELEWALFNALWGEVKNPVKLIKEYIALGANLHNPKVAFPLMKTMLWRFDDIKTLKTLVNAGVNINATDEYGQTIIFNHAYNYKPYHGKCNAKVIREYMKLGLDVKHKSSEGKTFIDSDSRGWGCGVKSFKELDENYTKLNINKVKKKKKVYYHLDPKGWSNNRLCDKMLWKCLPESNDTVRWQKPLKNGLDSFKLTPKINKKFDNILKHYNKVYEAFWKKHNIKHYWKTHKKAPILESKADFKFLNKVSKKRFLIELEKNLQKEFPGFWNGVPKKIRYRWLNQAMNRAKIFNDLPNLNSYLMVELSARIGIDFNKKSKWKQLKKTIDDYSKSKDYKLENKLRLFIYLLKNCCPNIESSKYMLIPKSVNSEYDFYQYAR